MGYWAVKISEVSEYDTVLIIGADPTGLCTLECLRLKQPKNIIVCEKQASRRDFVRSLLSRGASGMPPEECLEVVMAVGGHGGADRVIEVAGMDDTFRMAWQAARPNAIVTVVALYEHAQILPLPRYVRQKPHIQDRRR